MTLCETGITVLMEPYAVSDTAEELQEQFLEIEEEQNICAPNSWRSWDIRKELGQIVKECSVENWDGYGAQPVIQETIEQTYRFLRRLSIKFELPEISADPTGGIWLEWYVGPRKVFSVTPTGWHELGYTGLFGSNSFRGTVKYNNEIPPIILENLTKLFPFS